MYDPYTHCKDKVIGLYRDEQTLQPVPYFDKVIKDVEARTAIILDPMLATGGTMEATIDLLKERLSIHKMSGFTCGARGIAKIQERHDDVDIYTAAIDSHLNEKGYIIPGLGDAGDKIFELNSSSAKGRLLFMHLGTLYSLIDKRVSLSKGVPHMSLEGSSTHKACDSSTVNLLSIGIKKHNGR